jgi:hypothetical protein
MKHLISLFFLFSTLLGFGQVRIPLSKTGGTRDYNQLKTSFQHPAPSAKPWVYYFVLDGNMTKESITADFEAMARVGIGGLLYMEVESGTPNGKVDFAGPEWMNLISHACKEAKRLGLEINMNNDAGWNGSGGPWITPEVAAQKLVWSELVVDKTNLPIILPQPKSVRNYYQDIVVLAMPAPKIDVRIPQLDVKSSANGLINRNFEPLTANFDTAPADAVISNAQVIDLTSKMDQEGKLNWNPSAGRWLVMRFGHTVTGKENHPAPKSGVGLECDKLSKAAAVLHLNNLMKNIIQKNKGLTGKDQPLIGVHIDSWENGAQNWTPQMRGEFHKRRGYDMFPFLPVFSGRIVGSTEISERFLWDLRQTVSEMLIENYAGTFRELAHQNGLRLSIEAYGEPADDITYASQADEPMGEFWAWGKYEGDWSCTEMASAGHIYGKPIIGAEAFTSWSSEKWQGYPGNMKDLGDWALCEGINRFVFHRYAAQGFLQVAPGMSMGPFGLHYERTQTWWEQSKAWHEYLARCQSLLQQGKFVADLIYLSPEGTPRNFQVPDEAQVAPHIRGGYGYDGCSTDIVLNGMSVKDGKIILPSGMSYRALVLPSVETMTPALLGKIKQLADAGALIIGPKVPPVKSPSLSDMGSGDVKLLKTANELWASGHILTGKTAAEVLAERGIAPDFVSSIPLRWIHRKIGDADIYFVANPYPDKVQTFADFRVKGRQPELWHADNGQMENAITFEQHTNTTRVRLNLEPYGSTFVVFRKSTLGIDPVVTLKRDGKEMWSMVNTQKFKVHVIKASYGVTGDAVRTLDVTKKVQSIADAGGMIFQVSDMAKDNDPAFGVVKTLTVDFSINGKIKKVTGTDESSINLLSTDNGLPEVEISADDKNRILFSSSQSGKYELITASGKSKTVLIKANAVLKEITGPWNVFFDQKAGGSGNVTFNALDDWSQRAEKGIKFYSGTAIYKTNFTAPSISKSQSVVLDLGKVAVMAEVKLNGKVIGTCWKSPYTIDITDVIKTGENKLEINVVNLWINRQIGDENLPEDTDRKPDGTLNSWPNWLLNGQPSPTGRFSFTTWRLYKKGDKLVESGLLGPVKVIISEIKML